MNILFLTHKIPYPPNRGDRIPTFYRLQFLSKQHEVFLAFPCFAREELKHLEAVKKYCVSIDTELTRPLWAKFKSLFYIFSKKPLTLPYFYSKALHRKILKRIKEEKIDLIYMYSSSMGQYVFDVKGIKKIMDLADADSHKWLQYAKHVKPPLSWIYYREYLTLKEYEKLLAKNFDRTIAISEDEKKLFGTYIDNSNMSVVSNGVNLDYFGTHDTRHMTQGKRESAIVFVGAMDYFANIDAVQFFCREIFPIIKNSLPDIKFYIVGSNPTHAVRQLGNDKSVIVTGFVEDIRTYLEKASVFVAPLRIARGVQNKILEAMASGVPVVTTSRGNEGINAKDAESIIVKDKSEDFAESVIKLIRDRGLRNGIGCEARKFVEKNHNWDSNMQKLENVLAGSHAK